MAKQAGETVAAGPGYDPLRVQARVKAVLDDAPQGRVVRTALQAFRQGMREHDEGVGFAEKMGASLPPRFQTLSRAWRIECIDPGEDKAPAWVVRFEGSSTLERLRREHMIDANHLAAASTFVSIYTCAIELPRVTSSYQGGGGGARGPAEWLSRSADALCDLERLRKGMSKEEFEVVRSVAVFDQTLGDVAAHVKPGMKRLRATGYVLARLTGGLERIIDAA